MEGLMELFAHNFFSAAPACTSPKESRETINLERLSLDEKSLSYEPCSPLIRTLESTKSRGCSELMSLNQGTMKVIQMPVSDSHPMEANAWENLRRLLLYIRSKPVGTISALGSNEEALNYNQVYS